MNAKEKPQPEDDPFACSLCGCALGELKRISGEDYCDACQRETGIKPPLRTCLQCGTEAPQEEMGGVDVSPPDDYYPTIRYLCRGCSGGASA